MAAANGRDPLRVLVVTGIYPPDIGGPATHAADLVDELSNRGHRMSVLTLSDGPRTSSSGMLRLPRRWPWPVRMAGGIGWMVCCRRRYDVVYATGMGPIAVTGARLARRPVVLKIVADPAWERGQRLQLRGAADVAFDLFPGSGGGIRLRAMRFLRDLTVKNADRVIVPSPSLLPAVSSWIGRDRPAVALVANGARALPSAPDYAGDRDLRALMVCRLVEVKQIDLVLQAVAKTTGVSLEVVGDGPERDRLDDLARRLDVTDRVQFVGSLSHEAVLDRIAAADVLISASSHEGLPHAVLEALACGRPVVATPAGGVAEVIADGQNGLLIDDGPGGERVVESIVEVLGRLRDDPTLVAQLSEGAATAGEAWRFDTTASRIEALLVRAVDDSAR
jgi:glycosyltransferase involved in cell wall biosynthesis